MLDTGFSLDLLSDLDLNFELVPPPVSIVLQDTDHGPLCHHHSFSDTEQVIPAVEVQRNWPQGLPYLANCVGVEGGNSYRRPKPVTLLSVALSLQEGVEVPAVPASNTL